MSEYLGPWQYHNLWHFYTGTVICHDSLQREDSSTFLCYFKSWFDMYALREWDCLTGWAKDKRTNTFMMRWTRSEWLKADVITVYNRPFLKFSNEICAFTKDILTNNQSRGKKENQGYIWNMETIKCFFMKDRSAILHRMWTATFAPIRNETILSGVNIPYDLQNRKQQTVKGWNIQG
jgi:hypothetical protein